MVNNMIINVDEKNFDEEIKKGITLVDFYATWCGPCKMLGPVLEEYSKQNNDVKVLKVNIDDCNKITKEYGVMAVPTLIIFKDGVEKSKRTGFMPLDEIEKFVEENK